MGAHHQPGEPVGPVDAGARARRYVDDVGPGRTVPTMNGWPPYSHGHPRHRLHDVAHPRRPAVVQVAHSDDVFPRIATSSRASRPRGRLTPPPCSAAGCFAGTFPTGSDILAVTPRLLLSKDLAAGWRDSARLRAGQPARLGLPGCANPWRGAAPGVDRDCEKAPAGEDGVRGIRAFPGDLGSLGRRLWPGNRRRDRSHHRPRRRAGRQPLRHRGQLRRGRHERRLGARLPPATTYVVAKIGTDLASVPPRKRFDLDHLRPAFERSRERLGRERSTSSSSTTPRCRR